MSEANGVGDFAKIGSVEGGGKLPLLIEPREDKTVAGLAAWLRANHAWAERKLVEHGALLLRGFNIRTPESFELVARAIDNNLKNDYLGTSPRDAVTGYVFNASELPYYYPIPQHCEMTFTANPPRRLFFCCLVEPQGGGGETPLCDFRAVWRDLDPEVRRRFEDKGVRNIRNYCGPDGGSKFDLWKLKRWDEMFQTTDRALVEQKAKENGFECVWKSGGRLALLNTQPAMKKHPVTGETVWYNHSQVFHLSAAAGELARVAKRQRPLRNGALAAFARVMVEAKRRLTPTEDQSMHCTYGDGTEIPDADMDKVRDAIWKNLVPTPWRLGDVIAIDNDSTSHGRLPYEGPRKVVVCWA